MKKIWKYVAGFFTLLGGILIAFLSGKGAGRKAEKLKGLKTESKKVEKSLKEKKKKLNKIQKKKYKSEDVSSKEAADFLKKYTKEKK